MIYNITGVKRTPIAKKDGTGMWTKVEVKTQQTGDKVIQFGFSHSKSVKDNLKIGSTVTGRIETKTWESNGKSGVNLTLEGISAEYVYDLLLKKFPDIDSLASTPSVAKPEVSGSWDAPEEEINPDEIPF